MKIISYNVNGIRAAIKKDLALWIENEKPDVFCIQETKAHQEQVDLTAFEQMGYHIHWFSAEKKGYSGVAIFSLQKPDNVVKGIGIDKYDREGRNIRIDFGDLSILNAYFPSGTTGDIRQDFKEEYLGDIQMFINDLKKERPRLILVGDYNICHTDIDIHNPKKQQKTSGFLPHERQWVSNFISSGFVDSFRLYHSEPHRYSWWSYRAGSRPKNLGWRIDYQMVSEPLRERISSADILDKVVHSDHCPTVLEIKEN